MTKRKTKCTHEIRITTWHPTTGREMHQRCSPTFGCGEQLALGPSNDWPVAVDIHAAGLIQHRAFGTNRKFMNITEWHGMHGIDSGAARTPDWQAGATLMEWIACCDPDLEDDAAWPWDPTRPVAGQHEEWLIAQQKRHDVAASVVRHAETDGVAVDLIIGDEPETGVELEVVTDHEDEFPCERCETILREHDTAPGTPACPVDSQECQIRGRCTNKCGALDDDRACAACGTSDGCTEHQIFTCARCGRMTDLKDCCCDDEDDKGGDECSECWMEQQPIDTATKLGDQARQIEVPVTDVGDGVIVHHDGETATYTEEHDA